MVGDLLHDRYRIVDKLGFGGYSTIWLAHDHQRKQYVAVKVGVSSPALPRREANILRELSVLLSTPQASHHMPATLDEFDIQGPNGTHTCYTVTPAQGNLKEACFSRLFPIRVARALAAKLAVTVALVHSQGFVHGDIHLRNVLIRLSSKFDELSIDQLKEKFGEPEAIPISRVDGKPLPSNIPTQAVVPLYLGKKAQDFTLTDARGLLLSDFGEAFSPSKEQRLGKSCNTPVAVRAPEAFFEPDTRLSYPSDIWSLGTAIWEILGMKFIFSESETVDEVVAQQIDVLSFGNFPASWRQHWEQPRTDNMNMQQGIPRRPTGDREAWPPLDEAFEEFVQKYRRKQEARGVFGEEETQDILDLMRGMLKFGPKERLTIDEVLNSKWMKKWALPELK
ncbi:hypothetical protein ED733_004415 [Metarhizium rileyi]|uniref:Protein kinase domain-containing protein n=1 Tax=Metarhizium rileyi (strain RCEF 4871) TaxID=1649241 RepID=A0A5C6G9I0_METRR|nr:hypothetical protein ED733_004415 [Metarhizium rileyi]